MQINQLKKTSDINHQEFIEEYFDKKPVVITNKINHWPALKKWTPEYFKNKYSPHIRSTHVSESMYQNIHFNYSSEHHIKNIPPINKYPYQ